jgi:two-component system sensor histidine kinase SenX3
VDLGEVVAEEVDRLRPRAEATGLRLVADVKGEALVLGSEGDLGLLVHNLLDNAIHHNPGGGDVRVSVGASGDVATLTVSDTGIGIASRDLDRIFERFYRADPARSRETGGTGLGLSIVKHVAEAHGGDVGVQSVLGTGSTFTVRLPLVTPTPGRGAP